jgi:hypothetical protein
MHAEPQRRFIMQQDQVQIGKTYAAKVTDKLAPVRIDSENEHGGWNATNLRTNKQIRIKSAQRLRNEITVPEDDPAKAEEALQAAAAVSGGGGGGHSGGRKRAKKKLSQKERDQLRGQAKADQANAEKRDEREAAPDGMTASERAMTQSEGKDEPGSQGPEALSRRFNEPLAEAQGKKKATKKKAKSGPARSAQHANEAAAKARENSEGKKKLSCLDAAAQVLAESNEPMNTKEMIDAMQSQGLWTSDAPTPHATLYSAILREIQKKGDEARFRKTERGKFEIKA